MTILRTITDAIYAVPLTLLLIMTGMYFTIRTRGIQLRGLPAGIRALKRGGNLRAMLISTGARVGTGQHRRGGGCDCHRWAGCGLLDVAHGAHRRGDRLCRERPGGAPSQARRRTLGRRRSVLYAQPRYCCGLYTYIYCLLRRRDEQFAGLSAAIDAVAVWGSAAAGGCGLDSLDCCLLKRQCCRPVERDSGAIYDFGLFTPDGSDRFFEMGAAAGGVCPYFSGRRLPSMTSAAAWPAARLHRHPPGPFYQ